MEVEDFKDLIRPIVYKYGSGWLLDNPEMLEEICKKYHSEQLNIHSVVKSFYCQSDIEDNGICKNHCKEYYKPLEHCCTKLPEIEDLRFRLENVDNKWYSKDEQYRTAYELGASNTFYWMRKEMSK